MEISDDSLFQSDYPSNNERGGVSACYKFFLPLRVLNIQYLHECVKMIDDKLCNFVALYRSPSQTQNKFEKVSSQTQNKFGKVSDNLELNLGTFS